MAFNLFKYFNLRRSPKELPEIPKRGFRVVSGQVVTEDTAMTVSAYYRGVTYVSTQLAKLPFLIKDRDNNVLENDRIYYLLNLSPNNEMDAFHFKLFLLQNAIHHGNAYAEIERNMMGQPVALWPIPTQSVQVQRSSKGELYYKITGGSVYVSGEDAILSPKDILHIKNFHTKDGLMGQGLVSYAADTLGVSLGANQMAGNLFGNGGIPSGVLSVDGVLSDEAFERIKKSWQENHGGRKSGGVAVLENGVKFSPVVIEPEALQFLDSRKFGIIEVARFLGVPPTKLFDTTAATFNNIENSNLEVATDTFDAWAKNFENQVDVKLLNNQFGGRRSEMDLYAVFRGDMETRANYFSKMMQAAAMTPNEIRKREGLPPVEGGDRTFLAINNFSPMDRVDEIIDSQIKKNQPQPDQTGSKELQKAALNFLTRK